MAEKIRVHIKGKEYILKGEDELLVRQAAEEVDNEIQTLESSHLNQPPETVAILAALNIAEKRSIIEKQKMIDENYLVNELDRMAKYLDDAIAKGQPG
ncbi:cell division protein ZapA [Bacteroidota bacterium]